jgi:hypothetical protein
MCATEPLVLQGVHLSYLPTYPKHTLLHRERERDYLPIETLSYTHTRECPVVRGRRSVSIVRAGGRVVCTM